MLDSKIETAKVICKKKVILKFNAIIIHKLENNTKPFHSTHRVDDNMNIVEVCGIIIFDTHFYEWIENEKDILDMKHYYEKLHKKPVK